jgi:ribosomal protein L14
VYQFQLQVTDNSGATSTDIMQVTVNAAPNIPPVANAGADWTITLPANSLTVTGSGSDADGTISSYSWTKISGPPNYSIVNGTSAVTDVNGLVEGVYEFELKVTDNNGAKGRDTMHITVNAGPNIPPDANAGSDQTITLPENAVAIAGSGSDTDGVVSNYKWSKISGPANYTIVSQTSAATNITALVEGVYQFELEVTDNGGAIGRDTIQITVNAAANKAPVADAGRDQTITLPTDSLSLIGTGTDADGTIVGYSWSQISGPSKAALASPGSDGTLCSGLIGGTYQFELTVTDNFGSIGRDTVTIVVTEPRLNFDQKNSINIYPNPVVDITTVEINTAQPSIKLLLVVTDLKGVLIYKEDIAPGQNTILDKINLGNRAKGIYIVTVYFGDKTWQSKKLIKQ